MDSSILIGFWRNLLFFPRKSRPKGVTIHKYQSAGGTIIAERSLTVVKNPKKYKDEDVDRMYTDQRDMTTTLDFFV
jgi:hypothetical protein